MKTALMASVSLLLGLSVFAREPLPEGATGIASQFPGDRKIESHRDVIFVERFDAGSLAALFKRWETVTGKP
ncbi:hypothetical protein HQ560_12315, partial [bacterium]|nr:hypothetical protein [bacterium]